MKFLSLKCPPIYDIYCLWNVFSIKCPFMKYLSIKCLETGIQSLNISIKFSYCNTIQYTWLTNVGSRIKILKTFIKTLDMQFWNLGSLIKSFQKTILNDPKRSKAIQHDPKRSKTIQNDPKRSTTLAQV